MVPRVLNKVGFQCLKLNKIIRTNEGMITVGIPLWLE